MQCPIGRNTFSRAANLLSHQSLNSDENAANKHRKKSLMKALKMSIIHMVVFVLSWTPYTVMATWDTLDKESAALVPGLLNTKN